MHDDEVDTDAALVRTLLARQFPRLADLEIVPVPSAGTDNALYRLGSDMVVRLPRIGWAAGDVAKEHLWLPRLAPLLPVTIPTPLALGEPDPPYPWQWSVYPWLPGENPRVDSIGDPERLAVDIAGFVTALRAIDPAGGPGASRGGPLADRDDATRAAIEALGDEIDRESVMAAWADAMDVPAWTGPPTWIHGDLSPGNLLCVDGTLTSVIDFGGLGIGDPACDLIVAWNLLPAPARSVVPHRGIHGRGDLAAWTRLGLVDRADPIAVLPGVEPIARDERSTCHRGGPRRTGRTRSQ